MSIVNPKFMSSEVVMTDGHNIDISERSNGDFNSFFHSHVKMCSDFKSVFDILYPMIRGQIFISFMSML